MVDKSPNENHKWPNRVGKGVPVLF